jgi:kynurenine formamidase
MALLYRHGDRVRPDGGSGANELIVLSGHTGTHIDALCHISLGGYLYGDIDAVAASRGGRFQTYGAETIDPIVCRGVLLDMPSVLGLECLGAGQPISGDDLERACTTEGVDVHDGDAVLIRTGWAGAHYADRDAYVGLRTGVPGPDESAARWLMAKGVRVTGADTIAYECISLATGHTVVPVHTALLVAGGIHIIEVMNLEELARRHAYEFTFIAAPIPIVGATGAPVRPLALLPAAAAGRRRPSKSAAREQTPGHARDQS